jgi:hypothetical protein
VLIINNVYVDVNGAIEWQWGYQKAMESWGNLNPFLHVSCFLNTLRLTRVFKLSGIQDSWFAAKNQPTALETILG